MKKENVIVAGLVVNFVGVVATFITACHARNNANKVLEHSISKEIEEDSSFSSYYKMYERLKAIEDEQKHLRDSFDMVASTTESFSKYVDYYIKNQKIVNQKILDTLNDAVVVNADEDTAQEILNIINNEGGKDEKEKN